MLLPTTILGLATLAAAADKAIYVGSNAKELPDGFWASVSDKPTNASSAKFPGFDISTKFSDNSQKQDGWELSIALKQDLKPANMDDSVTATTMSIKAPKELSEVSDTWHVCVYTFTAHESSAEKWTSGQNPSCHGLVADECIDDLQKNGVKNFGGDACPAFKTTASCMRDLDVQTALALSVSAKDAQSTFGNGTSFYRRVDGVYSNGTDSEAIFKAGANQPMTVMTVFGPSGKSDQKAVANVACVMPNAQAATSGASPSATGFFWSAIISVALALPFVL